MRRRWIFPAADSSEVVRAHTSQSASLLTHRSTTGGARKLSSERAISVTGVGSALSHERATRHGNVSTSGTRSLAETRALLDLSNRNSSSPDQSQSTLPKVERSSSS